MNDETTFILNKTNSGSTNRHYYSKWFFSKDTLQEGETERSRKTPTSFKSENILVPEGKVVGLESSDDQEGSVLMSTHGIPDPRRVKASSVERVTHGFAAGDWVRLREEQKQHSPVGILHSINHDGSVAVGFIGLETLWKGKHLDLQMAKPYHIGQFVRLKTNVSSPRFEWPQKWGTWGTGKILHIHPNGCLAVSFPGSLPFVQKQDRFLADPAEVEVVSFSSCQGVLRKCQHLEEIHWAVRPLLVALGLFTAMKVGLLVGKRVAKPKMKREKLQGTNSESGNQLADASRKSQSGFPLLWPQ